MNIKVIYHSKTGNTKKVAEAIAASIGVIAEPISDDIKFGTLDILFIGDGVYGGKADSKTEMFIKKLSAKNVKAAVVFGTFGGMTKAITSMKELLREQGVNVIDKSFGCRAKSWLILNRKHPDEQDLKAAKEFACNLVQEIKNISNIK